MFSIGPAADCTHNKCIQAAVPEASGLPAEGWREQWVHLTSCLQLTLIIHIHILPPQFPTNHAAPPFSYIQRTWCSCGISQSRLQEIISACESPMFFHFFFLYQFSEDGFYSRCFTELCVFKQMLQCCDPSMYSLSPLWTL